MSKSARAVCPLSIPLSVVQLGMLFSWLVRGSVSRDSENTYDVPWVGCEPTIPRTFRRPQECQSLVALEVVVIKLRVTHLAHFPQPQRSLCRSQAQLYPFLSYT